MRNSAFDHRISQNSLLRPVRLVAAYYHSMPSTPARLNPINQVIAVIITLRQLEILGHPVQKEVCVLLWPCPLIKALVG